LETVLDRLTDNSPSSYPTRRTCVPAITGTAYSTRF